jgi:hypothetical protein
MLHEAQTEIASKLPFSAREMNTVSIAKTGQNTHSREMRYQPILIEFWCFLSESTPLLNVLVGPWMRDRCSQNVLAKVVKRNYIHTTYTLPT